MLNQELSTASSSATSQNIMEMLDLFYGNWIWRAVHALIEHPKFRSSPQWIADTLSISVQEAVDALEGLEELGLVKREGDKMRVVAQHALIPEEKQTRAYTIEKHKQLSQQIVSFTSPETTDCSFSIFFSVKTEDLWKTVSRFTEELRILDHSQATLADNSTLYSLTLTCNNLTPSLKKEAHK